MENDEFLARFESEFRALVGEVEQFKIRPHVNDLILSLRRERDFLGVVRSAASANIAVETGWLFEPAAPAELNLANCYLRLQLTNACVDERLTFFLAELRKLPA